MTWIDFLSQNLVAIIALFVSIVATIIALGKMKGEITRLNTKLEEGLDRCLKERTKFRQEVYTLKESLRLANIEVKELKPDDAEGEE